MFFYGVRFIGCTVIILHRCSILSGSMDVPLLYYIVVPVYRFIGRTVFVLHRCSEIIRALVHWAYRFCTTLIFQIIWVSGFSGVLLLYYVVAPAQFSSILDVLHVFYLRKCLRDSDFYSCARWYRGNWSFTRFDLWATFHSHHCFGGWAPSI